MSDFFPRTETAQRMNAMENANKNAGEPLWQNRFASSKSFHFS